MLGILPDATNIAVRELSEMMLTNRFLFTKGKQFTAARFSCLKCAHSIFRKTNLRLTYPLFGKRWLYSKDMNSKVYNQDCLEAMKATPDNFYSLAICDPPYGIGFDGKTTVDYNGWQKYEQKRWDSAIPSGEYFAELRRVSVNQVVWGGNYFTEYLPPQRAWAIWYKVPYEFSLSQAEMAWTSFDTRVKVFERMTNQDRGFLGKNIHPTQKPVALYKWLLQNYAKSGDTILDTHLGSGSSRIAAYDLGFDFTGYELDKDYFEAQEQRFADHIKQPKLFEAPKAAYAQGALFAA